MKRPRKEQEQEQSAARYEVVVPFQDARGYYTGAEPNQYKEGDDVAHFDAERLQRCIELGLVKDNGASEGAASETESTDAE